MTMDVAVGDFIFPAKRLFYKQLASNQVTPSINSHRYQVEPPQVNDEAIHKQKRHSRRAPPRAPHDPVCVAYQASQRRYQARSNGVELFNVLGRRTCGVNIEP